MGIQLLNSRSVVSGLCAHTIPFGSAGLCARMGRMASTLGKGDHVADTYRLRLHTRATCYQKMGIHLPRFLPIFLLLGTAVLLQHRLYQSQEAVCHHSGFFRRAVESEEAVNEVPNSRRGAAVIVISRCAAMFVLFPGIYDVEGMHPARLAWHVCVTSFPPASHVHILGPTRRVGLLRVPNQREVVRAPIKTRCLRSANDAPNKRCAAYPTET